jgi:glycosyltransferase involved in cell wall biosynthesis
MPLLTTARGRQGRPRASEYVLHVVTSTQRRGAELVAWSIVERLAGRHQLVALASGLTDRVLPLRALGPSPLHPHTLRQLRRLASRASVVVGHGSRTLPASVLALAGLPTPLVYVNIGDPAYWADTRLRRARLRLLYRRVDKVAALTEGAAAVLRRDFDVPSGRLHVIGTGRSLADFPFADGAAREGARRVLGLEESARVVAYVGALSPEKRLDVLVEAVAQLDEATLVVAGDGPVRAVLADHAKARLGRRAVLLGVRNDPARVLAAADVVALTSATEGLPGVCIEAGLVGRPVVASDVGFLRDVVIDGSTGYLVPPGDVGATARALQQSITNGRALGAAARSNCAAKYDLDDVVRRWDRLLAGFVGGAE